MKASQAVFLGGAILILIVGIFGCLEENVPPTDPLSNGNSNPGRDVGTDTIIDLNKLTVDVTVENPADYDLAGRIDLKGDEDYFRIYSDSFGVLEVITRRVPSEVRLAITVYDETGEKLGSGSSSNKGSNFKFEVNCEPGWHFVSVSDVGNSFDSTKSYVFQIDFDFEDVYEPNSTEFDAAEIALGEEIFAKIRTSGDVDYYSFTLDKAGVLTTKVLPIPAENTIRAEVYKESEGILEHHKSPYPSHGFEFYTSCLAGKYYIKLRDQTGESSADFYTLLLTYDTQDIYEPNHTISDAKEILIGDTIQFKLADEEDIDFFKLVLQEPDTIHFSFIEVPKDQGLRVILYDEVQDRLSTHSSSIGRPLLFEKEVNSTIYFSIEDNIYNVSGEEWYRFVVH
ncbi:MAG: hypothetical protein AAF587_17555 [Bacteroidota bacterium]